MSSEGKINKRQDEEGNGYLHTVNSLANIGLTADLYTEMTIETSHRTAHEGERGEAGERKNF